MQCPALPMNQAAGGHVHPPFQNDVLNLISIPTSPAFDLCRLGRIVQDVIDDFGGVSCCSENDFGLRTGYGNRRVQSQSPMA
eukprot:scaffold234240_cov36-Tisochrysis_lutea.AAC.1